MFGNKKPKSEKQGKQNEKYNRSIKNMFKGTKLLY